MNTRIFLQGLVILVALSWFVTAQPKEVLRAVVSADSVVLLNEKIVENCASRFALSVQIKGMNITVIERDTVPEKMRCICEYTLSTVLRGLPAGLYSAWFQREYLKKYGYPSDTLVVIGSVNFRKPDAASVPFVFSKSQTDCINTSVAEPPSIPVALSISPNPVLEAAMLRFDLQTASVVAVEVFTHLGQRLARFDLGMRPPGTNHIPLSADLFPSRGQYFCRVTAGEQFTIRGVAVLR